MNQEYKWDTLDEAAKANIPDSEMPKFMKYKNKLRKDGHRWEGDAEDILVNWILERIDVTTM